MSKYGTTCGTTHHLGCACHEAYRDACEVRLETARDEALDRADTLALRYKELCDAIGSDPLDAHEDRVRQAAAQAEASDVERARRETAERQRDEARSAASAAAWRASALEDALRALVEGGAVACTARDGVTRCATGCTVEACPFGRVVRDARRLLAAGG